MIPACSSDAGPATVSLAAIGNSNGYGKIGHGGTDADGNTLEMSGSSYEVVRRGTDGRWRFVIDHPDAP